MSPKGGTVLNTTMDMRNLEYILNPLCQGSQEMIEFNFLLNAGNTKLLRA